MALKGCEQDTNHFSNSASCKHSPNDIILIVWINHRKDRISMRNLKVKAKLSLSFGLSLLLIFVISTTSLLSMRRIQDQTNLIATETLSNTEHIWEMRTNLISSQRYALMAFADEDPSQISNYVNLATQEIDKTRKLFDLCKNSPEINQNKLEQFAPP